MDTRQKSPLTTSIYDLILVFLAFITLILFAFLALLDPADPIYRLFRIMDALIALVFLADFIARLVRSPERKRYFFAQFGWLDLLGGVPFNAAGVFRLARMIRGLRILLHVRSRQVVAALRGRLAQNTLTFMLLLAGLAIFVTGVTVLIFERGQSGANISTAEDALWWAVSTVSTVGYGDRFPVTTAGRIAAGALMLIGISIYGVLSAYLANMFIGSLRARGDSLGQAVTPNQLLSLQNELSAVRSQLDHIQSDLALLTGRSTLPSKDTDPSSSPG